MKIIEVLNPGERVISLQEAKYRVGSKINNSTTDYLYIVKYEGSIISFSTEYYKFAWKDMKSLRCALTSKFGRELAEALVEHEVIEIFKIKV